jgi:hypothetical protein
MKKVGQAHLFSKLIMIPVHAKKLQGIALPDDEAGDRAGAQLPTITHCCKP